MYLKKLELIGFKSFVDKTEFSFGPGVTGIVGPNGCGKSNVVDAFKWIFGEQSAKDLRGSEMKDVIFNGTQERKTAGYAEVTVVFDNSDRFFKVDFSEVAIGRRLFRSGESEYLINRQRCRLRDIRDLLMDTGIGTESYSMLEQGKIDVLLQASTLDRRIIFEEAAGISKYRARKAETLRALARAEENLARAGDIIAELEKQLQRVKIQAGKARKYREHAGRLQELRIRSAIEEFRSSVSERADLTFQRFFLDFQIARLDEIAARLRRKLDEFSGERTACDDELRAVRDRLSEARTLRERTEEKIRHSRRRLEELRGELDRKQSEVEASGKSLVGAREEVARESLEHRRLQGEVEERRRALQDAEERLERLRREHDRCREESERVKREIVQGLEDLARLGNQRVQVDSEIQNLESRRLRLETQIAAGRDEHRDIRERRTAVEGEQAAAQEEMARLETAKNGALSEVFRIDQEIDGVQNGMASFQAEVQGCRSRLEVLRSLEESLEGVARGIASLLRERGGASPIPGEHGLLARLLQVESSDALAVEAALGSRTQALVVETQEGALALLALARGSKAGAAEVIPLDRVAPGSGEGSVPIDEPGVLGWLRDRVSAPDTYRDLLDRLLAGVVLVEDLETALALSRNGLAACRLVTRAGELVEPWGALAITGDSSTGILSRRSEMESLERRLGELRESIGELEARQRELERVRGDGESALAGLERGRETAGLRLAALESQVAQLLKDEDRLARLIRISESEQAEIDGELSSRRQEREELEKRLGEAESRRQDLEAELGRIEEDLLARGGDAAQAGEAVTEAKVSLTGTEEREEGLRKGIAQLEKALHDREERFVALTEDIAQVTLRAQEADEDLRVSEEALANLRNEEAERGEDSRRWEAEDIRLAEIEKAFRVELDRLREVALEKAGAREKVKLGDQEGVLRRNAVLEKISEEYGIDLIDAMQRAMDAPAAGGEPILLGVPGAEGAPAEGGAPAAEGAPMAGSGSGQALDDSLLAWCREPFSLDRQAVLEEIRELQEKVRRIGSVNLEALDELAELEERLRFQTAQRDDLLKAERDLREIINEINKTSRELFQNTFAEVQRHFEDIFQKCFGGGKAELVLEDGADMLEAGIEIVARPPGKKLTSLSLMSGGEKTMTTIALLFAIFRARPSPFCILDEVDAALDENNVRRFVVLLKNFIDQSQFILITHNKITMSICDTLYGVTMQERGVSKRVAVEFETYDPGNPHASLSTADIDAAPLVESEIAPAS